MSQQTVQVMKTEDGTGTAIARELMELTQSQILLHYRFLAQAVAQLSLCEAEDVRFACDGKQLMYHPDAVLSFYKNERTSLNRLYLHTLFHCMLQHMYAKEVHSGVYWQLACDIAVEQMILALDQPFLRSYRDGSIRAVLEELQGKVPVITAELVYHYLSRNPLPEQELEALLSVFTVDDHLVWGQSQQQFSEEEEEDSNEKQDLDQDAAKDSWDKISKRALVELENFLQDKDQNTEPLIQNLKALLRQKADYSRFLRKFFSVGEEMQLSQDEFDYIFYTYGQNLYEHTKQLYGENQKMDKKVCLVEPLEFRQDLRIRDFAIIIDTSASVKGETVQAFLQKTYEILLQEENFFSRMNLHLIQCDNQVREDIRITNRGEMEDYIRNLQILGLGSTDFRPALDYVQQLCDQGEWKNLKGVLYFTDGEGVFPKKKPDFETAFVFLDDGISEPPVPPWALRIILKL